MAPLFHADTASKSIAQMYPTCLKQAKISFAAGHAGAVCLEQMPRLQLLTGCQHTCRHPVRLEWAGNGGPPIAMQA